MAREVPIFAASRRVQSKLRKGVAEKGDHVDAVVNFNGNDQFFVRVLHPFGGRTKKLDVVVRSLTPTQTPGISPTADAVRFGCGNYGDVDDGFVGCAVCAVDGLDVTVVVDDAFTFKLDADDELERFVYTMGNSGCPMGYIQTKKFVYSKCNRLQRLTREQAESIDDVPYGFRWACFERDPRAKNVKVRQLVNRG